MGFKISIGLLALLLITGSFSAWYIDRLQDNIATLKGNQIALENSINQQNEAIKQHLAKAVKLQEQNNKLSTQNQETVREVNKLRSTFANHDLDALALAKPGLVEIKINKAVKRLKEDFKRISDPNQFDESET
jgi:cell division protein FtsB